ncbi:MAG TPA: hypothetical protein VF510_18460 [Ktedonobacterales bacterium]
MCDRQCVCHWLVPAFFIAPMGAYSHHYRNSARYGWCVKIGSMVARREWPGFYKAIGIVFILLTLFLTSTYLFADTVAPNNADSSTATLLAGIPTMFMALVFEVARRLSRK